jgi:hypothetical protein
LDDARIQEGLALRGDELSFRASRIEVAARKIVLGPIRVTARNCVDAGTGVECAVSEIVDITLHVMRASTHGVDQQA